MATPWIRPHLKALKPYVPGEQPKGRKLVKLNTNENPYGPSPKVIRALREAVGEQLRRYPHPTAGPLRKKLASLHQCSLDEIIVGNGSDELLALATRAFVAPQEAVNARQKHRSTIQYFTPSYSLYPVLCDIQGALRNEIPLTRQFGFPSPAALQKSNWNPHAALTFITTPNAPSGRAYSIRDLRRLCRSTDGVIILDEAYVDFAPSNAMHLAREFDNVIVSRTFSKAYSLCFQRIGYFVGSPRLIEALHKIRDSYNVNGLAQVAAEATLSDLPYYEKNFRIVIREREKLTTALANLAFKTLPSAANFIFTKTPSNLAPASWWYEQLRAEGILVRWFDDESVNRYLRITIGTPEENRLLIQTLRRLAKKRL